jgi:uncharacterized protein
MCDPTAHTDTIGTDWMSATGMRPFFYDDPALVWLKYHGKQYGYTPDTSEYSFLGFLARKGHEFEQAWLERMLPDAVTVCTDNRDVYRAERVRETLTLMEQGVPAIAQAALWWPEERIYGIADLLIHTSRLRDLFPAYYDALAAAGHFGDDLPDYYIVCDLKFSSNLDSSKKKQDHACYAGQVRLYTYILGHVSAPSPSPPRPSPKRWNSSAGRTSRGTTTRTASTACARPSKKASSSMCWRTTPPMPPTGSCSKPALINRCCTRCM